jgi:hypothetical protein
LELSIYPGRTPAWLRGMAGNLGKGSLARLRGQPFTKDFSSTRFGV